MAKVLIIGADGQLGTDLKKIVDKKEAIPLTIKDIDIADKEQTRRIIFKYSPQFIINTAAYHNVDACEDNDEIALRVNAIGAKYLAVAARETGAILVHISTDYVFAGDKGTPYVEDDIPDPKSAYGISKLAGEYYVRYIHDKHFIIRTSGLYGVAGCLGKGGTNFVENMMKLAKTKNELKVVSDQIVSPTYTLDLARKINELVRTGKFGIYHITNNGECSWYEFAKKIFELTGTKIKLLKTTSKEFQAKAWRPAYSVLKNKKLEDMGMDDMPSWEDALKSYLKEKGRV